MVTEELNVFLKMALNIELHDNTITNMLVIYVDKEAFDTETSRLYLCQGFVS